MIQALLATVSFALSTICGHRSTRLLGGLVANFWRLVVATILLAIWGNCFGSGLSGQAFPIFVVSGLFGIGLGDVAFYSALPMLGSRLTVLLLQCFTTVFAAGIEWLWLGTRLTPGELVCAAVILCGVAIALRPREHLHLKGKLAPGLTLTVIAAFGNGFGLVLARKAYAVAKGSGEYIDGGTAAYQRVLGGLFVSGVVLIIFKYRAAKASTRAPDFSAEPAKDRFRRAWPWVVANGAFGMAIGVSFLQWALKTVPTGVVQSIVSVTPLVIIPIARYTENERPTPGALLGCVIAVAGTIAMTIVHTHPQGFSFHF